MSQVPDLNNLLQRLASMVERAQAIAQASPDYSAYDELDFEGEHQIWLGMECAPDGTWRCGWLMQPDEATDFVIEATGTTPLTAAQALLKRMEG